MIRSNADLIWDVWQFCESVKKVNGKRKKCYRLVKFLFLATGGCCKIAFCFLGVSLPGNEQFMGIQFLWR